VIAWLPVFREEYREITWFRFWCTRCQRTSVVGNDPNPGQCTLCLQHRPCLLPLYVVAPKWLRALVRAVVLAVTRADAFRLPDDLLHIVFAFVGTDPRPDSYTWTELPNDAGTPCGSAAGDDGISSTESLANSEADVADGRTTPPPYVGMWEHR
jgi:hypothetical protein